MPKTENEKKCAEVAITMGFYNEIGGRLHGNSEKNFSITKNRFRKCINRRPSANNVACSYEYSRYDKSTELMYSMRN